jgi:hypothetical protein
VAPENTLVLAAESQPKIPRPTLKQLKAKAARKGVPLWEVVSAYIKRVARTDPAATANWVDGPVDIPDVKIDDLSAAQLTVLHGMAESQQISLEEAIDHYGYEDYSTAVGEQLAAAFPAELSGFAHEYGGGAWIGFKGEIPPQAIELARTLPGKAELHGGLGYAETELPAAQERLMQALRSNPAVKDVATMYDPRLGAVEAVVVPADNARSQLAAGTQTLTEAMTPAVANPAIKINITTTDGPIGVNYDSYIRGGGNLGPEKCTSNFNLIYGNDTTNRRLGTAGHCTRSFPTTTYCNQSNEGGCTTIHSTWSYMGLGGDVGMYDHGTMTATRTFYWDWGQKAYVDGVSSGPQLNQSVCKFGFVSGYDCGTILKLNYSFYDGDIGDIVGGQVLTSILNGSTRCTFGDSGGPFFRATSAGMQAYGVLKGALVDDDNYLRCAFTPVNRFYNGAHYNVWSR